jgi:RNA polymerase sigma factor (sigma-70 family)
MYPTASINKAEALREALLTNRENTLERIYAKAYPMVVHYIKTHGGNAEDAKDVLQEAMILLYEKLMLDNLMLTSSITTYVMAICKNLWRTEYRKRSRLASLTGTEMEQPSDGDDRQQAKQLTQYMEALGQKCKDILVDFYYHNLRMEQISLKYQYRTIHSATVQKFKCLERLRKAVSSFSYNQFLN